MEKICGFHFGLVSMELSLWRSCAISLSSNGEQIGACQSPTLFFRSITNFELTKYFLCYTHNYLTIFGQTNMMRYYLEIIIQFIMFEVFLKIALLKSLSNKYTPAFSSSKFKNSAVAITFFLIHVYM
jgi:hypothetical protein